MSTEPEKSTVGLRIYSQIPRAADADIALLANAGVGDVSDVLHGAGAMDAAITAIYSPMRRIFGSAITVDLTPGDGLLLRAAVDAARPGDIIVANAHGDVSRAILGGALGMYMVNRGIRGLIVDGAVRDVQEFRILDFPVMATAVSPRSGTTDSGWGEVNVPIACGGAVVHPGDLVIGDEEGIIVVPRLAVAMVGRLIGKVGHPMFEPGTILERLKSLPPRATVRGIERVHKAVDQRGGVIVDGTYEDDQRSA
jgi:regulator of RNase E activity RraA